MTLAIGSKIPSFKAQTQNGTITDKDILGQTTIIYFYPKDDTPGCTLQACGFRDNLPQFTRAKTRVFGVSRDSLSKHAKFALKHELPFTLISDEDGSMCESFGTWGEKTLYGKKYMGIERSTFLVDAKGIVRAIWRQVKVSGHIDEVLEATKNII